MSMEISPMGPTAPVATLASFTSVQQPANPATGVGYVPVSNPARSLDLDGGALQLASLEAPALGTLQNESTSDDTARYQYHWIGGAADRTREFNYGPTQIMYYVAQQFAGGTDGQDYYWGHRQTEQIADRIREFHAEHGDDARIVLIGHSWGGATAMRLTRMLEREGIGIDTLMTLDPVSAVYFDAGLDNARQHVNVHAPTDWVDDLAQFAFIGRVFALPFIAQNRNRREDMIATFGGRIGTIENATNIEVPFRHGNAWAMVAEAIQRLPSVDEVMTNAH